MFIAALEDGDEECVAELTKLGERRARFRCDDYCARDFDGGENGCHVVRFYEANYDGCLCIVTALLDDAVFEYVIEESGSQVRESGGRRRLIHLSPATIVRDTAAAIHDDPNWSAEQWVAAKRAERAQHGEGRPGREDGG
jgi:hypothetical protein